MMNNGQTRPIRRRRKVRATRQPEPTRPDLRTWVAVMKGFSWAHIVIDGEALRMRKGGPTAFIPLFDTREQALAAGHDEKHLVLVSAREN